VDAATWARGRGWALWKAVITLVQASQSDSELAASCRRIIDEVIAEQKHP
jgi:aminoglycoside phosphotransferase (APT) family kinase protein